MSNRIGIYRAWQWSVIGCLIWILFQMPLVVAQAQSPELPWLVKPVPVVVEIQPETDFPIVTGLDMDALITTPNYDQTSSSNRSIFFDQQQYTNVKFLMENDPVFRKGWDRQVRLVKTMLAGDGLTSLKNVKPESYVYKLGGRLLIVALHYRMTGDAQAGKYLKAIALDAANRPMSFWMHRALRQYKDDWPLGQLETAILARGMAAALVWGQDLFTDSQCEQLRSALRDKGLYPMLRYLQTIERNNNFLPAIASGAMAASVALDDSLACEHSLALLNKWGALVEDDGSYGEQIDYFNYAFVNFAKGQMALGQKHLLELGKQLPHLKGTLAWQLGHYSLNHKNAAVRLNFGDDDYLGGPPSRLTAQLLSLFTGDGLGTWMLENIYGDQPTDDSYALIAKIVLTGVQLPSPVSPEALPLAMGYDTGIGIIRSGWTMKRDSVLVLRSGAGSRTRYSHDVGNRNAIAMMFHGDYLVVEPGRSSYRSKMRKTYDQQTVHHNTITFSGDSQIRTRVAQLLAAKEVNEQLSVLVSEAAKSYKQNPEHVRRSVYHLRDMDTFVVWDVVQTTSPETVEINWHFGNDDLRSTFSPVRDGHWQLLKPRTQLDTFVFTDTAVSSTQRDGIMHLNYSYYPGDKNEGQWGNAFELQLATQQPASRLSAVSVFVPQLRSQAQTVSVEKSIVQKGITRLVIRHGQQSVILQLDPAAVDDLAGKAAVIGDVVLNADGLQLSQ